MARKQLSFKTKGMNKDLSVSAFSPEFSFENMNLRLSTNENNTTMSWVNEKGTSRLSVDIVVTPWDINSEHVNYILGNPIGTAVLNHQLVLFTTDPSPLSLTTARSKKDYIYLLKYSDATKTKLEGKILYQGNLNFNSNYPLETLVSYEAEHIQKVYWTDGYNQPRTINIAASDSKLKKWNSTNDNSVDSFFDFVPSFADGERVDITQYTTSGGLFAPGVIQYAFTYVNKYGQQSNLVYVSPIYYLSHSDRGASPEGVNSERVTSSFKIDIYNLDQNFDYIRLYSIQRTSLNLEPIVKHLDDIPVSGTTNAELFSREIIYSNNDTLTLPVDTKGKILTVEVRNGDYSVTIIPLEDTQEHINSTRFDFIGYKYVDGMRGEELLMTLNSVLELLLEDSSYNGSIKGTYYYGITVDDTVANLLTNAARQKGYTGWEFQSGDITLDSTQLEGVKIVYNCKNQSWYLTTEEIEENEVKDSNTNTGYITYIDNGTTGSLMDPTELLFVGGKEISALTMTDKDHTLFLGNIEQKNTLVTDLQDYFNNIRDTEDEVEIFFENDGDKKQLEFDRTTGVYTYTHQLKWNRREISTFKGREKYRFGFQLQKYTGEWTEPIFIKDKENDKYPDTKLYRDTINLVYAHADINIQTIKEALPNFDFSIYKKIRPVIVFPTIGDRQVLCQGVLNPTVFNPEDRMDNSPFAQASWYFRPYMNTGLISSSSNIQGGITITSSDSSTVPTIDIDSMAVGSTTDYYVLIASIDRTKIESVLSRKYLLMDESIHQQHDPNDGEHDDINVDRTGVKVRFSYAIQVGESTYIFLRNTSEGAWPIEYRMHNHHYTEEIDGVTVDTHEYRKYTDAISRAKTADIPFSLYTGLNRTSNNLLYYTKVEDGSDQYIFQFYTGDSVDGYTKYIVTFNTTTSASNYITITTNDSGNKINYTHYSSLTCQNSANVDPKEVEIQGSKELLQSVFSEAPTIPINTQFFIDQSIVTLNSPDLEFDTEVQSYGTEGLKLRIIGAIPITASASAHKITATASLETNHNQNSGGHTVGRRELNINAIHYNPDVRAGQRLVSDYLWNDIAVKIDPKADDSKEDEDDRTKSSSGLYNYLIYPWQHTGALTNDPRIDTKAAAWLQTKKESNILFSANTEFLSTAEEYEHLNMQVHLQENEYVKNYRLPRQKSTSSEINYYPNIDKILTPSMVNNINTYDIITNPQIDEGYPTTTNKPISMRYKSTTHAVIALNAVDDDEFSNIRILPGITHHSASIGEYTNTSDALAKTFWGDTRMKFDQDTITIDGMFDDVPHNLLWLGEIYKDTVTQFGGNSKEAIRNNKWLVGGDAVSLSNTDTVTLYWTEGDTYYQRYDCLKTYPMTLEDNNQIIEILSFMCETHVNIDGRYDKNRGQIDNTNMHPTIFNQLNPVYSQKDNFFESRQLDTEDVKDLKYPNQIYYSKTKNSGSDVDLWTNVTLASTLEMDGDKGQITSLNRLNDSIIVFQDSGIGQVLYNENMQMSTTQGVPIEIANSGKVTGKRYFSDTIGCSNKWSIIQTPSGIYFMDSNDKGIYLFNGQLKNISASSGFDVWAKQNIPSSEYKWTPTAFNNFTSFYDKVNQDVLFVNRNTALAFSEKFGVFTSFYNYENSPYLCNLDDTGIWLKWARGIDVSTAEEHSNTFLWKHNAGDYCRFFGSEKPYWTTLVGNPEPQLDKIFTNLEFRATVDGDGEYNDQQRYVPYLPFDNLEVWNEYQHGNTELKTKWGHRITRHHDGDNSTLARNYRIWRCDIPRDDTHRLDRIRNLWAYLKLQKDEDTDKRVEIHDIIMTYFDQ